MINMSNWFGSPRAH